MNDQPPSPEFTTTAPEDIRGTGRKMDSDGLDADILPPAPAELHAISHALAQEFPLAVEATELVLMDVDPTRLHAFWSVMQDDYRTALAETGSSERDARTLLRLHCSNAAPVDAEIEGLQGSLYVDRLVPGQRYRAELAVQGADDRRVTLATSETLMMPGLASVARPPQQHFPQGLRLADLEPEFPNAAEAGRWRSLTLSAAASGKDRRASSDLLTAALEGHRTAEPQSGADAAATPQDLPAYLQTAPPDDLPRFHLPADVTGGELRPESLKPDPDPGNRRVSGSYSSSALVRPNAEFDLSVDLHVHGHAKAGSTVTLFGRTFLVGSDGRFSVNEPLPNGLVELALSLGRDAEPDDGKS